MARIKPVERRFQAFLRTPLSLRRAMGVIVTASLLTVIIGGALITLTDPEEFPDIGTGLWWALQTVTTVGYGDVVPQNALGRVVGSLFMLEAIAFVAIVTAAITSSFVERAHRERVAESAAEGADRIDELEVRLSEITVRLERIQQLLETDGDDPPAAP